MSKHSPHPSLEELSAYSLGQLAEDQAIAIDSHISHCEPCCETMAGMSSEDTFASLLLGVGRVSTEQTVDSNYPSASKLKPQDEMPAELAVHPKYEIVGLIGKGGMGDVYEAIHRKMERKVALKVINRDLFQKAEAVNRFHREVKTAAQLSHPNIVTSYDADQAGDFHFLVMEYVDGVDLSKTVRSHGALPVGKACDVIRQAAIGLQHAHELGMVHRDIKPHNLMLTAEGTIKILDFGLASLTATADSSAYSVEVRSDLTAVGAIMGTPDFISPEQASDVRQVDIRSDIYSLGATFYFLLSGRPPFCEGNVMHKLRSHAELKPDSLTTLRSDLPEKLVAIVEKMMAKDRNNRYSTPIEVAFALESFLKSWQVGEAVTLPFESSTDRMDLGLRQFDKETNVSTATDSRFIRINASKALVVVAILMSLLLAAVGYFFLVNGGQDQTNVAGIAWIPEADFQPSLETKQTIEALTAKARSSELPDWAVTAELEESFLQGELRKVLTDRICELLGQLRGGRGSDPDFDANAFVNELQGLYFSLKPNLKTNESTYQTYSRIAAAVWPLVLNGCPREFHDALVELTKPNSAVRINDRIAQAGRPTESLGEDLQVVHALALARRGDIAEAMTENQLFSKKLEVNRQTSRLPNLQLSFLNVERTPRSLQQQAVLQQAMILALDNKSAEAVELSASAGAVDTQDATADDRAAIQEILVALNKVLSRNVDSGK